MISAPRAIAVTVQRDDDGMLICVSDRYQSEDALDVRDEYKKYDGRTVPTRGAIRRRAELW